MSYRQIIQRFWYSAFACGLCVELLLMKAARDLLSWGAAGAGELAASGERQLSEIPGGVE